MKHLLLSLLLLTSFSCKTIKSVSADPLILEQEKKTAAMTDSLCNKIIASDDKQYNTYAVDYSLVDANIENILIKNQARDKALAGITTNVQEAFLKLEAYHKTHGTITNGETASFRAGIKAHWTALINAESALK